MFLTLLILLLASRVASTNFLKSRVDINSTNKIFDFFTDNIFPSLMTTVNERLVATIDSINPGPLVVGDDGKFGTYVSAEAGIGGLAIENQTDINAFDLIVNRLTERSVQFRLSAKNLELTVTNVTASVKGYVIGIGGTCGFDLDTKASLSSLDLVVDISVSISNEISFVTRNLIIGTPSLELQANRKGGGLCGLLGSLIEFGFNKVAGLLLPQVANLLRPLVSDIAKEIRGDVPLNQPINVSLGDGRDLSISPFVSTFQADAAPANYLELNGGANFNSFLSVPDWRNGYSYTNTFFPNDNIPDPEADQLVNINIGSDGVNSLVEPIWYLIWSNLATDSNAQDSPLCDEKNTATDPCPFPPFVRRATIPENLLLGFFFATVGWVFVGGYSYHVVVDPPLLKIENEQDISGTASASIHIIGRDLFHRERTVMSMNADLKLELLIPTYNSSTGVFSNSIVRFPEVEVNLDNIKFPGSPPKRRFWLLRRAVVDPVRKVVNAAFRKGISFINDYLDIALGQLQIKVPDIPIYYLNTRLETEFEGANVVGRKPKVLDGGRRTAVDETGDYIEFGSNLELRSSFVETPGSGLENGRQSESTPKLVDISVYDTLAYQKALTSGEVDISYSTTIKDPVTGESKSFSLRVLEGGEIETFDDAREEWLGRSSTLLKPINLRTLLFVESKRFRRKLLQ